MKSRRFAILQCGVTGLLREHEEQEGDAADKAEEVAGAASLVVWWQVLPH